MNSATKSSQIGGWTKALIEDCFAALEDGRTMHQGWSPQCEKEASPSSEIWGVLKTTSIQPSEFRPEHNKLLPSKLNPRPLLEVKSGDILITCAGPRVRCGISCLVRNTRPRLMISGKMYRFRVRAEKFDPRYVEAFLQTEQAKIAIDRMKTGSSESGLNLTHGRFRKLSIPIAPLDEQCRIVAEIEKQFTRLEAGVAVLRRAQANLKRYRAAVLKAACEGKLVPTEAELTKTTNLKVKFETGVALLARIREDKAVRIHRGEMRKARKIDKTFIENHDDNIPEGWGSGCVADFGVAEDNAIVDGPFGSSLKLSDYDPNGIYPVITITNIDEGFDLSSLRKITEQKYIKLKRSAVRAGDIIVAKIGSSYGKTGIYPRHMPIGIIPANLLKVTPSASLNWKYLFYHLHSPTFKTHLDKIVQYTAQPAFNVSKFKLLPIAVPPLVEQTRIVEELERRLSIVEELETVVIANLQRASHLRQAILQKAFTGKLVSESRLSIKYHKG